MRRDRHPGERRGAEDPERGPTDAPPSFLTKVQKQLGGERTAFMTNDPGAAELPHAAR